MSENFGFILFGVFCMLIAALNVFLTLKFDKRLLGILKQLDRFHALGFLLAVFPTVLWFFIIGTLDNTHVFNRIDGKSFVGQIIVSAGIISFPAIFFGSTTFFSAYLRNSFKNRG